jgi:hypothetical protein
VRSAPALPPGDLERDRGVIFQLAAASPHDANAPSRGADANGNLDVNAMAAETRAGLMVGLALFTTLFCSQKYSIDDSQYVHVSNLTFGVGVTTHWSKHGSIDGSQYVHATNLTPPGVTTLIGGDRAVRRQQGREHHAGSVSDDGRSRRGGGAWLRRP